MTISLSGESCIAVASGHREQVGRWGQLLLKARIQFEVRCFTDDDNPTKGRYAELWVEMDKVDAARAIIHEADPDGFRLW
jgi:hypothetical protein